MKVKLIEPFPPHDVGFVLVAAIVCVAGSKSVTSGSSSIRQLVADSVVLKLA